MIEEYAILILTITLIILLFLFIRQQRRTEYRARMLFESWRERECEMIRSDLRRQAEDLIQREVDLRTREWTSSEEVKIRKDAVRRSREVIHGKVTEHLIPFFPEFPWNPSDARFLGSPVDFVIFDGLSEGDVREVILVEVKSGSTRTLTPRERSVERCIHRGDVSFRLIHPDDLSTRL